MFRHLIILLLWWKRLTDNKRYFNYELRYYRCPVLMKSLKFIPFQLLLSLPLFTRAQDPEFSKEPSLVVYTGLINYQGDLNPNSFTIGHSNFAAGISLRKP